MDHQIEIKAADKKQSEAKKIDYLRIVEHLNDFLMFSAPSREDSAKFLQERLNLYKIFPQITREELYSAFDKRQKNAVKDLFLGVPIPRPSYTVITENEENEEVQILEVDYEVSEDGLQFKLEM